MLTFRTSAVSYFYLSALTDKASRTTPTADGGKWYNFQNWAVGGKFENAVYLTTVTSTGQ